MFRAGVDVWCYIIYYYTYIILLYIILYIILYLISYTLPPLLIYSSFPFPSIFLLFLSFLSSFLIPIFPSPPHPHPPSFSSFSSPIPPTLPPLIPLLQIYLPLQSSISFSIFLLSSNQYVSGLTYTYLYSINISFQSLTPHVLSEWMVEVCRFY